MEKRIYQFTTIVLLTVIGVFIFTSLSKSSSSVCSTFEETKGRYQIQSGTVTFPFKEGPKNTNVFLKIDTQTGTAWYLFRDKNSSLIWIQIKQE